MNPASAPPLVDRRLKGSRLAAAAECIASQRRVPLDRDQVLDLEKIADGSFSPLDRFLGEADCQSVLDSLRLEDGSPWPLPIILQVGDEILPDVRPGETLTLWNSLEDQPAGILELREVYGIDPAETARKIFGTSDPSHPGAKRFLEKGSRCLAGPVWLFQKSKSSIPGHFELEPAEVRALIRKKGWKTITGFQTRNLGHKAHERLQKIALELTDGLLIHPLIGWKKPGDMQPETILLGYELLIEAYFPKERVLLAALTTAMRYAGPREALFHALIRRNFGCTHFIVGRDHAGVGGFYEKYAAHRIFDRFAPGELGIEPLRLHGPSYCKVCREIVTEATCPHGPGGWLEVSGTNVRAMISRGERPPATIMRPEIADFLIARAQAGKVFFEG